MTSCLLQEFCGKQTLLVIEPERKPSLNILRWTIFALRTHPLNFCPSKQRRTTATAKSDQHPRTRQHPHCRLRNRCSCTEKNHCRVCNRNIPILMLLLPIREIQNASILLHDAAHLQIIDIRPLRLQDRLQFCRRQTFRHKLHLYTNHIICIFDKATKKSSLMDKFSIQAAYAAVNCSRYTILTAVYF